MWECELVKVFFTRRITEDIAIFCDLCEYSHIKDTKLPVLRVIQNGTFKNNSSFLQPISIPVTRFIVQRVSVYIKSLSGETPTFIEDPVRCTLRLKRII